MVKWRVTSAIVLLSLISVAPGCGGDSSRGDSTEDYESVRGLVIDIGTKTLLELESLTIEDESGTRWSFDARGKRLEGFTPSHVREHMVQGLQVTVIFHRQDGELIIDNVTD